MKKALFLLLSIISIVYAQNIMLINNVSGSANDTLTVSVEISNYDPFVGFQCDIILPDEVEYIDNSTILSDRASDHQVVESISDSNILTVFSYSLSMTEFSGTEGEIFSFEMILGTAPGNYALTLDDVSIADSNSQNIMTAANDGVLTIQAPDIHITPISLDYDRVPLLETSDMSFTIQNTGNLDLSVSRIYTNFDDFEILGDTAFILTSGNSRSVTIRFHSNSKGTYHKIVSIQSDDPDEAECTVDLSVIAYAVNELDINDIFGRSGYVSTLSIDISNMEEFVAFSFDLNIPEVLTLVSGSAILTERKSDHLVSASTLENGNVRVVAYSTTNSTFTGNLGDVVTLDFMVDGAGGYYSLNFIDPVIGDSESNNIISDDYNGTLEIAAADITVSPTSLNFGNVSVFDTLSLNCTVSNTGSDTLNITHLIFYDPHFFTDQELPLIVQAGENTQIPIFFHHNSEEVFNSTLRIRSNDPDEDPLDIPLSATSFIPNIMRIDTSIIVRNDTGWVDISIENHETFVAFQCDLYFSDNFTYLDEVILSDRSGNHTITAQEKSGNIISLFSYSLSQEAFSEEEGVVVSVKFLADELMGDYSFTLDDVIIGNSASENVMSSYENGIVRVITSGPTLTEFPDIHFNEDRDTLMNISFLVTDPNTSYENLIWTFSGHDSLSLNVINNDLHIEPIMDWFGERTVKVLVSDGELSDSTEFTVTIDPVNDKPVAISSEDEVNEQTSLSITLTASDVDADDLTYSILESTLHGTLSGTAPNLSYMPEEDYNGFDSLTFIVSDGSLQDTGKFIIEVKPVNDKPIAVSDEDEVNEDTALPIILTASDADDDDLTYSILSTTLHGSLSGTAPNLNYMPSDDYNGYDSLTFIVSDGSLQDTGKFIIEILPVNDAPVAENENDETDEQTSLSISLSASDVDNVSLTYTILEAPQHGALSGTAPEINYLPEDDYNGFDSLTFIVSDGSLQDTGKFIIEVKPVNDRPVLICALPDTNINEDMQDIAILSNIGSYFTDPDVNDSLRFTVTALDEGLDSLVIRTDELNLFAYTTADFFGDIRIILMATDDSSATCPDTMLLTVNSLNDAPVFTELINLIRYFEAETRDTIAYEDLFYDIDTPNSGISITISSTEVQYDIVAEQQIIILYLNENETISETIQITLNDGDNEVSGNLTVEITEVSVEIIPDVFALHSSYPNPFNPITTIMYDISENAEVILVIYNVNGQKIKTLVDADHEPKSYRVIWNGENNKGQCVSTGMYICRIIAKSNTAIFIKSQKLLYVK